MTTQMSPCLAGFKTSSAMNRFCDLREVLDPSLLRFEQTVYILTKNGDQREETRPKP